MKLMSPVGRGPAGLLVSLGIVLSVSLSSALDVPPLSGPVVDLAHVLSSDETAQLTADLRAHETRTGNQVVVLILPSLEGEVLDAYSHRVATTWKLGQKGIDNAALLLIALKERKVRIEVGYGLEGTLTDLRAAQIIRNEIVPRFRADDMYGGVRAGTGAILKAIEGTYQDRNPPPVPEQHTRAIEYVFLGIVVGFLAGAVLSQGLFRARALLGSALAFLVAQVASIPLGAAAAAITAVLLWALLGRYQRRARGHALNDWMWYSSRGGGWSDGSFGSGGFSGHGGDFGGGGASGQW